MNATANTPLELTDELYARLPDRVATGRRRLGRPLTLTEKILLNHLADPEHAGLERGQSYVELYPDRVALQDATGQMALLQFMTAGLPRTAVPTAVHADHLIQARIDAATDLAVAEDANDEVYDFLRSAAAKYGIEFWKPGSGIIHQVTLEQYAFPGGMMIGADSHTPNGGGLGMVAIGVGGADTVDVMVGGTFGLRWPTLIGIHLTGELNGWASPKDVILEVARILTVRGGTGAIVEYFGPGAEAISTTGKATICNMGAEIGATTSLFAFDDAAVRYLEATGRAKLAERSAAIAEHLRPDPEVLADPAGFFDEIVEVDLSALEPHINGPHSPDRAHPVSRIRADAAAAGWPRTISSCLIGSCTNSSYEDISRTTHLARQAAANGLRVKTPLMITPGSERVRATIERDGLLADLEAIGATVLANACGPCIGQWQRDDVAEGQPNVIVNSYNRNFPKRNDGSAATLAFLASPETVMAYALAGTLDFNPLTDTIDGVRLTPPIGDELPTAGFERGDAGFVAPPENGSAVEVVIRAGSERLQLLEPFPEWNGKDFVALPVLVKAKGKCTTDHISAAGPWLRYRGHLDNISRNLFLGVVNAFTGETGVGRCPVHDGAAEPYPDAARHCRDAGVGWVVVGDENYGEGSSREQAAMEPRFMNGKTIVARSFARIAETNLKKQGLLPLTFADPAVYDEIREDDTISVLGLDELAPDRLVECRIQHADGTTIDFQCTHTMSLEHIDWFRAGGALNLIRNQQKGASLQNA